MAAAQQQQCTYFLFHSLLVLVFLVSNGAFSIELQGNYDIGSSLFPFVALNRKFANLSSYFFSVFLAAKHWTGRFNKPAESPVLTGFCRVAPVHTGLIAWPIQLDARTGYPTGSRSDRWTSRSGPIFKTMRFTFIKKNLNMNFVNE